jgi:hypothetical protein
MVIFVDMVFLFIGATRPVAVFMPLGVAAVLPLRVAAALSFARNRSARFPAPSDRAGATPCTRNGCSWRSKVCWSCLGCNQYSIVAGTKLLGHSALCPYLFSCSLVLLFLVLSVF